MKELSKSEKKLQQLIDNERDKHSQELFGKYEFQLAIAEVFKLDQYITDLGQPIWKPIIINGNTTKYEVSNAGLVRNKNTGNILVPQLNHKGYLRINLYYNHKANPHSVHRLVAQAFIPNPDNKPQINHITGVKTCNWIGNLEWVDNSENQKHAYATGLQNIRCGVKHPNCQHNEEEVHQVCKLLEKSVPISEITKILNVSRAFVIGIKYQGNWKDIRSKYNIPESNTYGDRTKEQIEMIDSLLDEGLRNRKEILKRVGLPDTNTNISYVKYRIRIKNNKGS